MRRILLLLSLACLLPMPAMAQQAIVVSSCNTLSLAPGYSRPIYEDTGGNQCGSSTFSGSLPAGSNIIGKVGIDQTTPGTTNGVQVNAPLPAGTNLIGKTSIDQTTPGTTNGVTLTDGTNTQSVKAASTSAALTDKTAVVAQSPNPAPQCPSVIAVTQTSSTDLKTLTNFGYICSVVLVSATGQNVSLVEGTGTVCATNIAGLIGGTTASVALAANGGFSAIAGVPWLKTQTTADHICLLQSGVGNVSGVITYQDHL